MLKKISLVFILAFALNLIWEVLHSRLYLHYQGGPITFFVLARAAAVDAGLILIVVLAAQRLEKHKYLFVALAGLVLAVAIEVWALKTGRWAYGADMPIVPIIRTGLTPTVQLAVTALISQKLYEKYTGAHQAKNIPR